SCGDHRRLSHAAQPDRVRRCHARSEARPLSSPRGDAERGRLAKLEKTSGRICEISREHRPRIPFEARADGMIYFRSALFLLWVAAVSVTMHIFFLPVLLLPRRITVYLASIWTKLILFGLRWTAGLGYELRGETPKGAVIVASKHFTMWETIALMGLLPDPAIVLKRSLFLLPFYGWYGRKMEMIPIDRSAGGSAIRRMHAAASRAVAHDRPIVIFPEGTRKQPGDRPDYKPGVAGLYLQLDVPCVPVAHNSGLFWTGWFLRRPG